MIAALADSDEPCRPGAVRRVPGRAAQGRRMEPPAPRVRPVPAHRPRRHQHLRRLRRDRPHSHQCARAAAASSCPRASPPTQTTAPFFGDLVSNGRLVSFLDFENEAFLLSHGTDWSSACASACLTVTAAGRHGGASRASRHSVPIHPAISRRAVDVYASPPGDPARQSEHRHHPSVPVPPRRRDHDRHLQARPSPLARRSRGESVGPVVHADVQHGE